ncbi:hypothetical protein EJ08DRAFT_697980 [Tothia fuscella]|uniref:Uncharacterized protein n=1 Tax=Tothia fuscella TaxID=1048955 RepID=A0A9P4NQP8_9PEZI|nr:hypothetical protein EJ08DRAFT_697980 [Tothia fuscella]
MDVEIEKTKGRPKRRYLVLLAVIGPEVLCGLMVGRWNVWEEEVDGEGERGESEGWVEETLESEGSQGNVARDGSSSGRKLLSLGFTTTGGGVESGDDGTAVDGGVEDGEVECSENERTSLQHSTPSGMVVPQRRGIIRRSLLPLLAAIPTPSGLPSLGRGPENPNHEELHVLTAFMALIFWLSIFLTLGNASSVTTDITLPGASIKPANTSSLTPSGTESSVSVQFCEDINYRNCLPFLFLETKKCYDLVMGGLSSVGLAEPMYCKFWSDWACRGDWVLLAESYANMFDAGFDDRAHSVAYFRFDEKERERREEKDIDQSGLPGAIIKPANTSLTARGTELGVAIDLCEDINFQNCQRDVHLDGNRCYDLFMDGLSSVGFEGNMRCRFWAQRSCSTDSTLLHHAVANMKDIGFNDRAHSVSCFRDNKKERRAEKDINQSGGGRVGFPLTLRDEEPVVALVKLFEGSNTTLSRRDDPLGVAVDLCEDINYQNCHLNMQLLGDFCYDSQMGGLSSIRFEGNMNCMLWSKPGCKATDNSFFIVWHSVSDMREYLWNDRTASLACHRWN